MNEDTEDTFAKAARMFGESLDSLSLLIDKTAYRLDLALKTLNYVADMTYCDADANWRFKPDYDPQKILDTIQKLSAKLK